ncbi:MAG TPA: hypothetical protein VG015_00130 [Candidatus Dormibacteraeota bacterium]|jgi:hypothetical protein|nr:hypothetical protein [Candidatus Dormibacteraeota bacterium]
MALPIALLSLAGGAKWVLFVAIVLGIAVGLLGFSALLWWLSSKVGQTLNRWAAITLLVEVALLVVGVQLFSLAGNYQPGTPQNPGTDGPFADGGMGAIGLTGMVFVLGSVAIIARQAWQVLFASWSAIAYKWRIRRG